MFGFCSIFKQKVSGKINYSRRGKVDLNNKEAVSKAIAEAESSLGNIDGVFYSTPMSDRQSASIIADLNSSH